ncbi:MurR/RpiR family transcriptional regulator [Propionibacterium freudenreichii]|uniref:Transcriptional regulator, RpiR family n=1 Tax=Propionibacterium freudenreichii subsp. shermanii (strain ATCC 9614 / DSM 4902 / CIP 103027 / NCIMB 8099 / CIRM-BIA1) TaxID=754252 RepID=D7GH09_PROFC|nr:MurR/RpiR family transcriptional regulator [Propionibacterium freudenreichii]MCQ1999033.1 MurR/RpiR family transcriptional regulator [Propionibacterium freudenreichii]MCT2980721.1 MurR/RpiR family transcriptional regulator [Propionibacterium freudenreichii]MCT3005943.1 MurR/RpiR family transcriptional regulator [Propionibacterium freudenreichii]MCT3010206.1 MurR/RpiR family transcriptional regulator [Propionibacterium freudenreichii]MCT3014903.1 MurR/RpiR family transcriptional regulator [P
MARSSSNSVSTAEDPLRRWLGTVQARSAGLVASEAKVVDLVLEDPLFVGRSTTAQVAERAGVSAPSVIRAARAIGFSGFAELKLEIARARGTAEFFAPPHTLTSTDSTRTIIDTTARTGIDALTALSGAIDPDALDQAVSAIRGAGQLLAYGAGPSATVAADVVFRLRSLGVRTSGVVDHESAMIAARLLDPGDVVVAVSSTGRTDMTVAIADAAATADATVIAITNQYGTPLTDVSAVALVVGGAPLTTQMAAAGSRLAQLVVVDALAAALALRDPDRVSRAERAGIDLPDIT